jgi:hypothetical protein
MDGRKSRRVSRFLATVGLSACAVLFAGSAIARAARTVVQPETFLFEAEIPTKHGWAAFLRADGHRRIELFIHHYDEEVRPYETMSYKTVGHVDRHGISADFDRFGEIHLDFPSNPKRELFPFPNCRGSKPEVIQYGEMHGKIDFEALGGLIRLDRTHVEGQTRHSPRRTCVPKPSQVYSRRGEREIPVPKRSEPEFSVQTFLARGHLRGRTVDLFAIDLQDEVIDLAASSTRRFGSVLVQTTIHAPESEEPGPGKRVDLTIFGDSPRPKAADLEVAPPFLGSARYRTRAAGPPSWLGDLAVQVPGEGELPLAGPEFRAVLCGYLDTQRQRDCERAVASPHTV